MFRRVGRRTFLGLVAASAAPAGTAGTAGATTNPPNRSSRQAEAFELDWQRRFDGYVLDVEWAPDGGLVTCGLQYGDSNEEYDAWVLKTDDSGDVDWQRTYEQSGDSGFDTVVRVDDGYVLSEFVSGDSDDERLTKLDDSGSVEGRTADYGGDEDDQLYTMVPTGDGYALAGWTYSYTTSSGHDAWLLKVDANGVKQWDQTYGTDPSFYANALAQAADGGYVLAGGRWYSDDPRDAWVLKTDDSGASEWQRTFGGDETDNLLAVARAGDGYLVAGYTQSTDVEGLVATARKLDADGTTTWSKRFTDRPDSVLGVVQSLDSGSALLGGRIGDAEDQTAWLLEVSPDGDVSEEHRIDDGSDIRSFTDGSSGTYGFGGQYGEDLANGWLGAFQHRDTSVSELSATDVSVSFENNFRTESTEGFLGSLYNEVRQGMPIDDPTLPDENTAYIHVDLRVTFDDQFAGSVDAVRPKFTHDQTEETFSASNVENFLGDVEYDDQRADLHGFEDTVYGWDNFRVRAPTQVGIQLLEGAVAALSAGMSAGEVTNPVQANTEAYPDVYLTALEVEGADGETVEVDVDERLPRYDDVCTSVGFSGLVNDQCSVGDLDRFGGGTMVLSPATVALVDDQGRVTGRTVEDGEYVTRDEIPGALYSGPIRHEFVLAPDGEYRTIVDGQDSGTATVVVEQYEDGTVASDTYADVEVDDSVRLEGRLDGYSLAVDRGRDGTVDEELAPTASGQHQPMDLVDASATGNDPRTAASDTAATSGDDTWSPETGGNQDDDDVLFGLSATEVVAGGAATAGLYYLAGHMQSE